MTEGEIPEGGEGEAAAVGGEADAPAAEPNESEAGSAPDDLSQAVEPEDPKGVAKRIGKLLAEKRELEQQLEAEKAKARDAVNAEPAESVPAALASITDPAELARQQGQSQRVLDLAEELLDTLATDPDEVARTLQRMGVKPKAEDGSESYDVAAMGRLLRNERRAARDTLRAIPQVEAQLKQRTEHSQVARKAFKFLAEPDDERTQAVQRVLERNPEIRRMPYAEYWATCAVLKHRELQAAAKGGTNGVPATAKPAVKPPPRATGGSSQPKPAVNLVRAKERLAGERSKEALTEVFEALG